MTIDIKSMLFIVIPAYNEETNIGRVISGLFSHGFKNIIVVDDGSADKTFEIAKSFSIFVLHHEINRGQGAALQTGDEFAILKGADIVVHFDADGQFNPVDITGAVAELEKTGADAVLGSRFLDGRSKLPWTKRYLVLPVSKIVNRFYTGVKLTDAHNGFRVLSRKALEKIRISQDGMAHNSDIVRQIKKNNLKFTEFPVQVIYHEYGQGIGGGAKIIWEIFQNFFIK